jgi:hypothetical protein
METNLIKLKSSTPIFVNYNFQLATLVEESEGNNNQVYPEGILTCYRIIKPFTTLIRKELNDTSIRNRIIYI